MASQDEEVEVWVIEDEPAFRNGLKELLDAAPGMRCTGAFGRCENALKALTDEGPPEIVLVDIGLPGMSGIEGIRRMKELSPTTKYLVLSIHEENENVFNAICAGASGYLVKNLPPDALLEKIREATAGGAPMAPGIARKILDMLVGSTGPRGTYGLTDREREVLDLMVQGLTRVDIAGRLFVSLSTVNTHSRNIYEKLHVHTRGGAVAKALKERLV